MVKRLVYKKCTVEMQIQSKKEFLANCRYRLYEGCIVLTVFLIQKQPGILELFVVIVNPKIALVEKESVLT
jgi:hypothetical protein